MLFSYTCGLMSISYYQADHEICRLQLCLVTLASSYGHYILQTLNMSVANRLFANAQYCMM